MSFELVDNLLQVLALVVTSVVGAGVSLRHRSRLLLTLALGHACVAMGTLYYVLCLVITGSVPQVFYVSEVSWIASYLFLLSMQIMRSEGLRVRLAPLPSLCAIGVAALVLLERMMGPSYLVSGAFALTMAAIVYITTFRLAHVGPPRGVDACILACVALQLGVYLSSSFMGDFTRFNLYFAIDLAFTSCLVALLPLLYHEEVQA